MKIIAIAILFIVNFPAAAAGIYDGIWKAQYQNIDIGYISIHENNGQIVLIFNQEDNLSWGASVGTLIDDRATVESVIGTVKGSLDVVFTSSSTLESTQTSCSSVTPGVACALSNGAVITATKIF